MLVDCGHTIPDLPPGHVGATGYATWHQGTPHEEKICYACADERTRASLLSSTRVLGYLHREGGARYVDRDYVDGRQARARGRNAAPE